jgi:uncharacterized membrane-anchored protein YhcB (DUF1043 family)
MKKILILAIMSTYAMSGFTSGMQNFTTVNDDKRLCKVFIKKAQAYQATMSNNELAKATLESYKDRVVSHCSTVAASTRMRDILAEGDNKVLCKTSIRDAHEYQATMNKSKSNKEILEAHKAKIVSHCGSLIAKS